MALKVPSREGTVVAQSSRLVVGRSWLLLRGGGGVVVVLSVVGRVLMQVGCKKFATTPRSIQFKRPPILPNELQGSPLIRPALQGASWNRTGESGQQQAVRPVYL